MANSGGSGVAGRFEGDDMGDDSSFVKFFFLLGFFDVSLCVCVCLGFF